MEKLEAALEYVFRRAGIERRAIPHLLRTEGKPYASYYNRATRDVVASRFARDIKLFGYAFEDSTGPGGGGVSSGKSDRDGDDAAR